MNQMKRKAAARIALVTLAMAALASPLAWYVSRENAEEEVVALAQEEARRVLRREQALRLDGAQAREHAGLAARQLAGGLFDIAEIYGPDGSKLAETVTPQGEQVEAALPKHGVPRYAEAFYERLTLDSGEQVLRVFVPLREAPAGGPVTGYFEGVRVLPQWQTDQIFSDALVVGLMVCLASLVCGAAMYPVVVHLVGENERKAREVLESHIAMMEALGRAIAKRDSDTGAHNYRVAWVSALLGEALGLKGAAMQSLILGSFLHDAGKIGIPDAILLKPGRLDEDEMRTMRTHVRQGEEIVSGAGWLDGARDVEFRDLLLAHHHHAVGVLALDVGAGNAGIDFLDLAARHQLDFLDGPRDRVNRRLDADHDALLDAFVLGFLELVAADAEHRELPLGIEFGGDGDDLRGADVEADDEVAFAFLAHDFRSDCWTRSAKPFG